MTCGSPPCKREWHRRSCARWNRENSDDLRAHYLRRKLEAAKADPPAWLPLSGEEVVKVIQEVMGIQQMIIIEHFGRLLIRRFQDVIRRQHIGIVRQLSQLPSP